jgi:hypothetical protein
MNLLPDRHNFPWYLHRARDLTHCDDYHQNIFAEKFIQILGNDGGY